MAQTGLGLIKRLVKHGNAYALIIDRPVLNLLKIPVDAQLQIETDGQKLVITKVQEGSQLIESKSTEAGTSETST